MGQTGTSLLPSNQKAPKHMLLSAFLQMLCFIGFCFPSRWLPQGTAQRRISLPCKKAEQTLHQITAYKYLTCKHSHPDVANNPSVSLKQYGKLIIINKEEGFFVKCLILAVSADALVIGILHFQVLTPG